MAESAGGSDSECRPSINQSINGVAPPKHERAAGGNPTSRDANDDQRPLPAKRYDERREERHDDEDGESESQKEVRAIVEAIDARAVQVSMKEAKQGG